MPFQKTPLIFTDAEGFEAFADENGHPIAVISFSRREVEAGLPGDAVDRLMRLSDAAGRIDRFESAVLFQFEGYDTDPRELPAIPECRKFFAAITEHWPCWFHFLVKDDQMIPLAISLLTATQPLPPEHGPHAFMFDQEDIQKTILRLFSGLNGLYAMHGIGADKNLAMTRQVTEIITRAYGIR